MLLLRYCYFHLFGKLFVPNYLYLTKAPFLTSAKFIDESGSERGDSPIAGTFEQLLAKLKEVHTYDEVAAVVKSWEDRVPALDRAAKLHCYLYDTDRIDPISNQLLVNARKEGIDVNVDLVPVFTSANGACFMHTLSRCFRGYLLSFFCFFFVSFLFSTSQNQ